MTKEELKDVYNAKAREAKIRYEQELKVIEEEYMEGVARLRSYNPIDETTLISIAPLRYTLKQKGLTMKDLAPMIDMNAVSLSRVSTGQASFKTDKVAKIAAVLQVPVSSVIQFNGFVCKPDYETRYGDREEFIVPDSPLGIPTYQPMRDLIKSFYADKDEKKTVSDLYNMIKPKEDGRKNCKGNIEGVRKALATRGIDLDNPKHNREKLPGLSTVIRTKLNRDETVNMRVIYEICKLLHCNIDFVMGWK